MNCSMDFKRISLTLLWMCATLLPLQAEDYNILDFGAKPDGKTLCSTNIQQAIDQAHADGGGRVLIPGGTFLSGTIVLKSGVELHLEKKATLLGSTNPADYRKLNRWIGLVMADQAENISVTGRGTIDGQGAIIALHIDSLFYAGEIDSSDYVFPEKRPMVTIRPQVIEFVGCKNVNVSDITIRNAASWVQSYYMCENLRIEGITVDSDTYWNNDGIDIIDCRKVRITGCDVNASDDGICIKSYGRKHHGSPYCDSIYIGDCRVRSSASAVKFGTATFGGFRNCTVENIKVYDTFRSAIAIESYGKGFVENILVQNITAKNTGNAIFVRLGKRYESLPDGTLKNIIIRNVKCEVPFGPADVNYEIRGPELPYFHNIFPASITGIPGNRVFNIRLENIEITYPGRGNKAFANLPVSRLQDVPEQIELYPEYSMFGELPAWGFYVRHVENLIMKNIRLRIKKPDYRPAIVLDDVKDLEIKELSIKGDFKPDPVIFHNVEGAKVEE